MCYKHKSITEVIEKDIACLMSHGGGIEFVSYDEKEKKVFVRLTGACGGCLC